MGKNLQVSDWSFEFSHCLHKIIFCAIAQRMGHNRSQFPMPTDKTQELFARLETGLTQLLSNGDWQDYLRTQSRFHSYSFNNILLIFSQYPSASQIAGYRTWQQLGRQVKKGEKAIQILAPIKRRIESETEEATWNIFGFKKTSVFDISQTEGEELPSIISPLQGNDAGLISRLVTFSQDNGVPVYFKTINPNGYCRFDKQTGKPIEIAVQSTLSQLHQAKTLIHEILY